MDEKRICQNIMKLRKARNMSMRRLAELTGLTKGYISRIEKADKAPPFSTLSKISNALNASLYKDILSPDTPDSKVQDSEPGTICVVRKNGRERILGNRLRGHHYEALAHKRIGKNMEPFLIESGFDEPVLFSHEGEEFLFAIEGSHEFTYGNRKYILHEGDSVYFDSAIPHGGRSIGEKKAKLLAVMYSYKRFEPSHLAESVARKGRKKA